MTTNECRHCGDARRWQAGRGLCHLCHDDRKIRQCYPVSFRGARGVGVSGSSRLPAGPTQALPGSEEKILVLMARAEQGVALHHPLDSKISDREIDLVAIIATNSEEEDESDE